MDDKYICIDNFDCSVYVFGSSSGGVCPECGLPGAEVNPTLVGQFLEWYETARSRPFKKE